MLVVVMDAPLVVEHLLHLQPMLLLVQHIHTAMTTVIRFLSSRMKISAPHANKQNQCKQPSYNLQR